MVLYKHIYLTLFSLGSVKITNFLPNNFSNAGPLQILKNHRLRSIYSWMKEIYMIPI